MSHIKIITPETAETIQLGSVTVRVLEDGSLTDNRIGTILSTLSPYTEPLAQHARRNIFRYSGYDPIRCQRGGA